MITQGSALRHYFFPITANRLSTALLFLFPIFAVSVRHWVSVIFVLLALLAIFTLRRNFKTARLTRLEIGLLGFMALFFLVYVLSSLINGWSDRSIRLIERELRFLFFIPLYLLVRQLPRSLASFGCGAALALVVTAVIASIQFFFLGYGRDIGVYGPLFTGPITVLFLIAAMAWAHTRVPEQFRNSLIFAMTLSAVVVAILCSRSAVLGASVAITGYYLFVGRNVRFFAVAILLVAVTPMGHESKEVSTAPRFESALDEAKAYLSFQMDHPGEINPHAHSAVGTRLEMLRSLQYFLRDYPLLGVGGYNYREVMSNYVLQGLVSGSVTGHAHPHNIFAQVIVSKGLVGLVVFITILALSAALMARVKDPGQTHSDSGLGHIFLIALILMNLTESALVLKGNYIACALVLLAVFITERQQK